MKRLKLIFVVVLVLPVTVVAQDITRLRKIGPVTSYTKIDKGLLINCRDNSQVQLSVLAPDLIRVRASFAKAFPSKDHSWAIAKESWQDVPWTVAETPNEITLSTSELQVVIHRSTLLIDFHDPRTRQLLNSDEQPMAYDADATLTSMMFDPKAGMFVAASKKLGFDEHFYGLGEKAARLDKRRDRFVNWNSDTPGYVEGRDPIYQTIPFYIGLQRGVAYGIFFDNSYRSYFDFGRSSQQRAWFGAEGGELNYYFFYGPSLPKILGRYAELTGHMPLPPIWALGNQQSRWSYYPDTLVEEVVRQYRERDLPLDVVHLDIDYMQAYRVFTFDTTRFSNPKALSEKLAQGKTYQEVVPISLISDYQTTNGQDVVREKLATKANIHSILDLLAGKAIDPEILKSIPGADKLRKAGPDDLVIISFSSHGYADNQGNFYLVPYDVGAGSKREITGDLLRHCISSEELSLWLREVDAGEMVMIVDACHSAASVQGEGFKPGPMGSRGLGQLSYDKGIRILTSTQSDDVALETDFTQQGLLTYALTHDGIEAGKADFKPQDKAIMLTEWLEYAADRVPELYVEIEQKYKTLALNDLRGIGMGPGGRTRLLIFSRDGTNSSFKKGSNQQPSLFDFTRKKKPVVLVQ